MAEATQDFRKKQAILIILVFACIVTAFFADRALLAVAAILAACGLCFAAAKMQPEPPAEEHH
jgi:hypothetical protein